MGTLSTGQDYNARRCIYNEYTRPDVAAGEHSFSAQLVNNDHTPLSPPVFRTVKVTVT